MSEWKAKRFWTKAEAIRDTSGYAITLDGRPVKTPAKSHLVVPTQALAQAIAAEWDAQDGVIDPGSMPFTRSANAAIDKVTPQREAVADMIAAYGDADLLCYRATRPDALVARQSEHWDPVLAWARETLGAELVPVAGVMHSPQSPVALNALTQRTHALDPFELAGFHDLVSLSGSLVLGFATAMDHLLADHAWTLSRLDELWQIENWGDDAEAEQAAEIKKTAFLHAKSFIDAARSPNPSV